MKRSYRLETAGTSIEHLVLDISDGGRPMLHIRLLVRPHVADCTLITPVSEQKNINT